MAGPIKIAVLANASQAKRELDSTGRAATSMGSKFSSAAKTVGKFAAAGLVVAGAAAVKFGADAVRAASEAQQSIGATQTVFGKFSKEVIKTSDAAAEKFGLSAHQYRESSNLIGSLLKNQGVAMKDLGGETQGLIKKAADLSATFGGDVPTAAEAMGAALKGEFERLESYGISIKAAQVTTEANTLAQRKYGAELEKLGPTQQTLIKRQATMNLLNEQSKDSVGAFARESNTLANRQQVLAAKFENVKVKIGTALLPILTDLTDWVGDKVIPKLEEFGDWLNKNSDEISATGSAVASTLLPVLKDLADIAGDVVGFIKGLPAPVREFGIQAGIAALAVPKLNGALMSVRNSTGGMITNIRNAETRMAGLKGAAGGLAGPAGLGLLMVGAQQSDKKLGTLMTTAGGVATGFAVGGPIGAAVGGFGGLVLGLSRSFGQAGESGVRAYKKFAAIDSIQVARDSLSGLKDTLDQVTGAYTGATRAAVLQRLEEAGLIKTADQFGISSRTVVNAALGQKGAMDALYPVIGKNEAAVRRLTVEQEKLRAERQSLIDQRGADINESHRATIAREEEITALDDEIAALEKNKKAKQTNLEVLRQMAPELRKMGREVREDARATQDFSGKLRGLPKKLKVQVNTEGIQPSIKGIARLAERYRLTPKQIKTLITASGVDTTVKAVKRVQDTLKNTEKVRGEPRQFKRDIQAGVADAADIGRRGTADIQRNLEAGPKGAKADLGPFNSSLSSGINTARGNASSGGRGIGSALGAGVNSGIGAWTSTIAITAANAVTNAINAARRAADARSPSRKMIRLGLDMSKGLEIGIKRGSAGIDQQIDRVIDRITTYVDRKYAKSTAKSRRRYVRQVIAYISDERRALERNGEAQDRVNAKLQKAREHYKSLVQQSKDYAASVRESIIQTGNVTQLNADDGTTTSTGIIDRLQDRLVAAQRFAELIRKLTTQGLNKTSLQQMLAAGVEGGLATAEAIASGGAGAISQINTLTNQIASEGKKLGEDTSKTFYGAGIKAADGVIDGLEKKTRELDRAATRLARNLIRAVRRALGIKSPSRVFRDLGKQSALGLTIGLEDIHVSRAGDRLAHELVSGFGTPALDAFARVGGPASNQTTVQIRLTAEQLSQLQRGREVQADLDFARTNGVRGKTF